MWTRELRIVTERSEQPLHSALYSGRIREQRFGPVRKQFWVIFYTEFSKVFNENTYGRWKCIGFSEKDNMKIVNQEANCVDGNWLSWFRTFIGGLMWTLYPTILTPLTCIFTIYNSINHCTILILQLHIITYDLLLHVSTLIHHLQGAFCDWLKLHILLFLIKLKY